MTLRRDHPTSAPHAQARKGFTILETLVCIGIVVVAGVMVMAVVGKVRRAQHNISCISNLQNIGAGFRSYALEHQNRMPDPGLMDKSWERILREGYYDGSYCCPADGELAPVLGSSYDWRDTGVPSTTMAGRSLADVTRSNGVLVLEAMPGWHGQGLINIVRLDGSTATITADECFGDLATPIRPGDPTLEKRNANLGR
jgi:hypothetical protein